MKLKLKKSLLFIYVATLTIAWACNNAAIKNVNPPDSTAESTPDNQLKAPGEPTEQSNGTANSNEILPLEIISSTGGFEEFPHDSGDSGLITFKLILNIKNNTNNNITNATSTGFLEMVYKDGTFDFLPHNHFFHTEEDYLKNTHLLWLMIKPRPTSETPWKEGEICTFTFNGYNNEDHWGFALSRYSFERTPESVTFFFKYEAKGISIDDEHEYNSNFIKLDVLNLWKEYQKKLGLR